MAIKEWYQEGTVSAESKNFRVRVHVLVDDNINNKEQNIVLSMQCAHKSGVKRYRHSWTVKYFIDGTLIHTDKEVQLPNNNAASDVISKGYLQMAANKWYTWGSKITRKLANNGSKHTFKVEFTCNETSPRSGKAEMSRTMPNSKVTPAAPKPKTAVFDEETRTITYDWEVASPCQYICIHRIMYSAEGVVVVNDWLKDKVDGTKNRVLYNRDRNTDTVREDIPENVVKVDWYMRNFSETHHWVDGNTLTTETDSFSKVWIKDGESWKKAIPWVKVEGTWKKVSKTYVKDGSEWKRTKS